MKLKQARQKSGLTQTELAKKIGSYQTEVSKWEAGTIGPSSQQMKKMNKILIHAVDWKAEFAPLDSLERSAALKLGVYLTEEIDEETAATLVFNSSKYDLRKLLRAKSYLPIDHTPGSYIVEPLLPPGVKKKGEGK